VRRAKEAQLKWDLYRRGQLGAFAAELCGISCACYHDRNFLFIGVIHVLPLELGIESLDWLAITNVWLRVMWC